MAARRRLSTFNGGAFLPLDPFAPTVVHRDALEITRYVRVSGFNRGARARAVSFVINGTEALYSAVQPNGNSQLLMPNLPLYNTGGAGLEIHARSSGAGAWTLRDDMQHAVVLRDGRVDGIMPNGLAASADAQPILLIITDARRTGGNALDPRLGGEAIVELYPLDGGSVGADVLASGGNFEYAHLHVHVSSGVFLLGDLLAN